MKNYYAGQMVCWFALTCTAFAVNEHPSIYGNDSTKQGLKEKIEQVDWAGQVYGEIKASVDPHVDRHVKDPEWIVSRLQMHWKTHYSETYVNGAVWSHGSGKAPVPTPRFAGGRDWDVDYARPKLEDIRPYDEDERGIWLQNIKKEGRPWEWAPVSKTGQIIERINEEILGLAEKSAFLYWYTGQEKYAKFSSDILWTYVNGMYHRSNPKTFENHGNARIIGLATFEVIHEGITVPLAVIYDYLYDYLIETDKDVSVIQAVFKRWADRIIEGGSSGGNWNINQARFIVYMGLTLEDDSVYSDSRGKQYYVSQFTTEKSNRQKGLKYVVPEKYDPVLGVWPEAPGYAFGVTNTILRLSQVIYNSTGKEVLDDYPILIQAAIVVSQYLFPNGHTVGFGDAYHEVPEVGAMELLMAKFRRQGDRVSEQQVANALREQIRLNGYRRDRVNTLLALTSYVDKILPESKTEKPLETRTFYADTVNFLAQRNGKNAENGLMLSLVGTKGGHMHANGMAMELYGMGMVLAPDFGRGPSYWNKSHGEFYAKFAAHNTVVVDGRSDYNGGRQAHPFKIMALEPEPGSYDALCDTISFSDTAFQEPATDSIQRRMMSLVRTSDTTGYYVDIFRSRRKDGKDIKHEYLYHNIGQDVIFYGTDGHSLEMQSSNELSTQAGDLKGYDYFMEKFSVSYDQDFSAVFSVDLKNAKDVCMKMWMAGQNDRVLFKAKSPVARSVSKGSVPGEIRSLPVPTVIVRQNGQAWDRPFVAVYEPYDKEEGASISKIRKLNPKRPDTGFVGIAIDSEQGGQQYVLNNTTGSKSVECEGVEFAGLFGIVSENPKGLSYLYLGKGTKLSKDGMGIDGCGKAVNAYLEKDGDTYYYSSDSEIKVMLDKIEKIVPAAHRVKLEF